MTTVAQILKSKPDQSVATIEPDAAVFEAVKRMAERNVGALVVLENGRIAGIITERDYARKVALRARSSQDTPVRDVMTSRTVVSREERAISATLRA